MDPRLRRRCAADDTDSTLSYAAATEGPFRQDLERIRFSPYFSRLASVTQVVSAGASASALNNRLTHTIKVTAVARAIAQTLRNGPQRALIDELGGCDAVVVQAAASAHDLGHPPFGHLGERTLDRVARQTFGLADGFEGNAQSFRILTELDVHGADDDGLNLTAAVRAAILKYPWARFAVPSPHPGELDPPPRGAGPAEEGPGTAKFSAYLLDSAEMTEVMAAYPRITAGRQTPECAVMDIADDIAYSLHDLDDFHRAGVLQHASVAAEVRAWLRDRLALAGTEVSDLAAADRKPGHSLELLRRRLHAKDSWIVDDEIFGTAVGRVATDLVDGLLAVPFDSSIAAERAVSLFTASWIEHLRDCVIVEANPHPRAGHIRLNRQGWHEVQVLKFIHQRFVLDRPDLALYQRGQAALLTTLATGFAAWLDDDLDKARAPRRLLDLVELAINGYRELAEGDRALLRAAGGQQRADIIRLGTGRGIIDYLASLTDGQALSAGDVMSGGGGQLWGAAGLP